MSPQAEHVIVHAGAHELKERTRVPLQTNLIAYNSHANEVKEWYYYPESSSDSNAGDVSQNHSENNRAGPITKDELKMYYAQNKVSRMLQPEHCIALPLKCSEACHCVSEQC